MWAIVPFDVGHDYAMWATIMVKRKMRPTSQRNCGPLQTESVAHFEWDRCGLRLPRELNVGKRSLIGDNDFYLDAIRSLGGHSCQMGEASMSRTFRILVAKAILASTSTTAGAAVVSQSKTTVVDSPVNRPLLAQTNAEAMHIPTSVTRVTIICDGERSAR